MARTNDIFKLFSTVAFLLLFSSATAHNPPCPSFCRFRLCFRLGTSVFVLRDNPNLLLRPAGRPQGVFPCEVRRSGTVRRELRNVISGEASVSPGRSGRPFVPISDFKDARPRFQHNFFKFGFFEATQRDSIVRRPTRGNQGEVLEELCERIPIVSHDLLRRNGRLRRRVRPRGAKACVGFRTRVPQLDIELIWNTQNDFNIRLEEPSGFEINRGNPVSPTGGRLGSDSGADGCIDFFPSERLRYLTRDTVPSGEYTVMIDNDNQCSPVSEVTLRVTFQGRVMMDITETVTRTGAGVIIRKFEIPGSDAPDFSARTLLSGIPLQDSRTEPAIDGSGVMYNVTYDMMLTQDGVVSLSSLNDLAEIECNTDGSVRVRLSQEVAVSDLNSMYPERSILVISRELFGECNIAEDVERPGETEDDRNFRTVNDRPTEFVDTYLIIESVSGNPRNAVIRGKPTTFFALFDSADISITPIISTGALSTVRQDLPDISRGINVGFPDQEFTSGIFRATVAGGGEYTGEFVSFSASWDLTSVDVAFRFINQWEFSLSLDAAIDSGSSSISRTFELLSIPLYGLPAINFLENLSNGSQVQVTLPTLRFGVFFEVPLTLGANGRITRELGSQASASYTTSRTEVTLFIRGPFLNIDVGATTRNLAPPRRSFEFTPIFASNEETEVEVTAMANVRPQFVVYVPILSARVSIEAGVEVQGQWAPGLNDAFPPLSGGLLSFGICDECHDIQVTGTGTIQNAGIFVEAGLDIRVSVWRFDVEISIDERLASITLPNNPSVNVDIAQGCFVEPIGEDGPLNFIAATSMCEACPEEMPTYNPTRRECEGECMDPEPFFNQATMECEACPPETPTFNEGLQICEANCPGGAGAGNDVPFFGSFELGSPSGVFNFRREHFTVRDQMAVIYEGGVIHDTGCVGGSESIDLSYNGTATNVIVRVTPNCAGTTGTAWNFDVSCPAST